MAASEGAEADLNAQLDEVKQKIHELQEELGTAKLQNADLKAKNADIRKRRTADRKQWTAEQQRGFQYQREIHTLKVQLSAREREQRCGNAHHLYTIHRSTPTALHVEGNDQNIKLVQLENKKLRSRQSLLEDTMEENQALHEDGLQKAKQIGDLMNELECTADDDPSPDHQIETLEQEVTKPKESANSDRNRVARLREDNWNRAREIARLTTDNQQKATEIVLLTKKVEQQEIELEKHRTESEQQECHRRRLVAILDSMGITKDDLGNDGPQTKKPSPTAVEPALDVAGGLPATPAQLAAKAQSSAPPSVVAIDSSPEQTASDHATPGSALAQAVDEAIQGARKRPADTLNISIETLLKVARLGATSTRPNTSSNSLLANGQKTTPSFLTVSSEMRQAPGTR